MAPESRSRIARGNCESESKRECRPKMTFPMLITFKEMKQRLEKEISVSKNRSKTRAMEKGRRSREQWRNLAIYALEGLKGTLAGAGYENILCLRMKYQPKTHF